MIITLCGSARFEDLFHRWNLALTLAGHCVFSLAAYPSVQGRRDWYDDDTKARLDIAHKLKIQASDAVVVLNRDAYIGESTLSEIEHARMHEKPVHFLESWGEGCGRYEQPPSPIATFTGLGRGSHRLNRDVWSTDLLGPGGHFRSHVLLPIVRSTTEDGSE